MKRLIRSKTTGCLVRNVDDVLLSDTSDVQYLSVGDITVASYINKLDTEGIVLDEDQCMKIGVSIDDVIETGKLVGFMAGYGPPESIQCHAGVVYIDAMNGHTYQRASDGSWFRVAGNGGRYGFLIYYNGIVLNYLGSAYTVKISCHDIEFKRGISTSGASVRASTAYGTPYAEGALVLDGSEMFDFIKPSEPYNKEEVVHREPYDRQWQSSEGPARSIFTGSTTTRKTSRNSDGAHATYYYSLSWKGIEDRYNVFVKSVMRSALRRHLVIGENELSVIFNVYCIIEKNDVIETRREVYSGSEAQHFYWETDSSHPDGWWRMRVRIIDSPYDDTTTRLYSKGVTYGSIERITSLAVLTFAEGSSSDSPYVVSSCEYKKSQSNDISDKGMDDYKITVNSLEVINHEH